MATSTPGNGTKTATTATTNSDSSMKEISSQLEALKADLSHLTEAMGDYGRTRGREFRDSAKSKAAAAQSGAEAQFDRLQHEAEYYGRRANEMVQDRPGAALGVAAGLGFLIGLFAARR